MEICAIAQRATSATGTDIGAGIYSFCLMRDEHIEKQVALGIEHSLVAQSIRLSPTGEGFTNII